VNLPEFSHIGLNYFGLLVLGPPQVSVVFDDRENLIALDAVIRQVFRSHWDHRIYLRTPHPMQQVEVLF
jgi:hypothetical protein